MSATASVERVTELVGREAELARIEARLRAGKPAVVVLLGEPELGKTSLLREAGLRAHREGWLGLPAVGADAIAIHAHTAVADLWRRFAAALTPPAAADGRDTIVAPVAAPPPVEDIDAWVSALISRSPLLVRADSYRPSDELARWLEAVLTELRRRDPPVVFIVAGDEPDRPRLDALAADETIVLGPLPAGDVRRRLQPLARHHSMAEDELDRYVEQVRRQPALLESLARLLELDWRGGPAVGREGG